MTLDPEKCKGCTHCVKRCPTEAIRVRGTKAQIISELCIDCGECIRVCPHHAKRAVFDPYEITKNFTYKIALPAPALYGQIANLDDIDYVLTALRQMGFDDVFEVARGAEIVSDATRRLMHENALTKPAISSACPAVLRLIRVRFPNLCGNLLPLLPPMEIAARMARSQALESTGLPDEEIGVFFVSPCPAKVTDVRIPAGREKSAVSGVLSMAELYPALVSKMNKISVPAPLSRSGIIGVSWAGSGGESSALLGEDYLAADGIENVIKVLEQIEDRRLRRLEFVELNACAGGCVGGVLTVENPYVAKARLQILRKYMPVSRNHLGDPKISETMLKSEPVRALPVMKLSEDLNESMRMMSAIDKLTDELPALDCGSCGAPTCRALAEDIVRGNAMISDCVYKLREQVQNIAKSFKMLEG
ncbi:MAG TPA: ferredoxin [Ruminococcaceae bacterium]|nr:ferredoxin [Oscillospiraceae bacterium]